MLCGTQGSVFSRTSVTRHVAAAWVLVNEFKKTMNPVPEVRTQLSPKSSSSNPLFSFQSTPEGQN